jgi:signal transduction histidine kinase
LVADVQESAKVERDAFAVQLRAVSVNELLADTAAFVKTLPGDHPLIVTDAADNQKVWADPDRIDQVVRNLLSNAAKYSPAGAPIELRVACNAECVRIEVADRGYGIHPDDVNRIFEKFGRGRDRAGQKVAGVGLGLYLSRYIVRAHGSELEVDSTPGVESIFAFELEVVS